MITGIPEFAVQLALAYGTPRNALSRIYSRLTDRLYGILHEKNGADKNIVCAILYFLHSHIFSAVFRKT